MPPPNQRTLDPLPFGNHGDSTFRANLEECESFLQSLPGTPSLFDAIGKPDEFQIALCNLDLPELNILAGSSTPKSVIHQSERATFLIPFGTCESVIFSEGIQYQWGSPNSGFFIPAGQDVTAESSHGAFLRLEIHPEQLETSFANALGLIPDQTTDLPIHKPSILPLKKSGLNWQHLFRSLAQVVEAFGCDAQDLTTAGLDNVFVRTCLTMLAPELLLNPDSGTKRRPMLGGSLDRLLEQIEARITERITLSDLEAWSGRAGRSIQQAFQQKLGMSPTRWILSRRLELLRALLLQAPADATIAELARSCGLSRMATVIPEYTRRFGEKPRQTRARRHPWAR